MAKLLAILVLFLPLMWMFVWCLGTLSGMSAA